MNNRARTPLNTASRRSDAGMISVEFLAVTVLSLLVFTFLTNFVLVQYGRGVVRAAADEGARAGARVDLTAIDRCTQRTGDTLNGGMGRLGSNLTYSCAVVDDRVIATAHADFAAWFPGVPDFEETAVASAVKEQAPE